MSEVDKTALRWHGGKFMLAPWIIEHFPNHRIYCELFGGAANILLRKARSYAEIYNDLDDDVVNYFRILRDEKTAAELRRLLELTPYSRTEYLSAYERTDHPIERARRIVIRSYQGFGSASANINYSTGFRASSFRSGTPPAKDWMRWPDAIPMFTDRLRGVVIENKDYASVMDQQDREETLFYVDPPYLPETRNSHSTCYAHEMTIEDHERLCGRLLSAKGMVVLSGYESKLYRDAFGAWTKFEKGTHADGASDRIEILWMNPAAVAGWKQTHPELL